MNKMFVSLFMLLGSIVYTGSITTGNVSIEQINGLLPQDWRISEIKNVESPIGWSRISGDPGIQITLARTPYSLKPEKTKSGEYEIYYPKFYFCIMPDNFSGESGNGALFKNGKVEAPALAMERSMLILTNIYPLENYYIFYSSAASFADFKNPKDIFDKILIKNRYSTAPPQSAKPFDSRNYLKQERVEIKKVLEIIKMEFENLTLDDSPQFYFKDLSIQIIFDKKDWTQNISINVHNQSVLGAETITPSRIIYDSKLKISYRWFYGKNCPLAWATVRKIINKTYNL